jgi:hypothetical protein
MGVTPYVGAKVQGIMSQPQIPHEQKKSGKKQNALRVSVVTLVATERL